jgi:predicted lipoprotein with Yx(FWY)xxD motif
MRPVAGLTGALLALALAAQASGEAQSFGATDSQAIESFSHVPMPPGFKVVVSPLEGPVFADAHGKTLYNWPIAAMRQGYAGDPRDKSVCGDKITTKTGGYMSPYPEGLDLPELDRRKSCKALWAPVVAGAQAKAVGDWSVITRSDGAKQWAYDHHALYTSYLDWQAGDVIGGTTVQRVEGDSPAERIPVGPPSDIPPGFIVESTVRGRMLLTDKKMSVYASDHDAADKSNCDQVCAMLWHPLIASAGAQPHGDWTIIERSRSIHQWAFHKRPLYTYVGDVLAGSLDGSEESGWHNVYTQLTPPPPTEFSAQETINGDVLADSKGQTVYFYHCGDDSADQLSCDTVDGPQAYRLAVCGGGDVERCNRLWRYVPAAEARSKSRLWTVLTIDPATGHEAQPRQAGSMRVWAYRGRPVYTYAGDTQPGDFNGQAVGEWQGRRNGFRAFWIRSETFIRT